MPKKYWLMKSEAECYSIDDLKKDGTTYWDGVRNYQARNLMRDDFSVGDAVLFYHSSSTPSGIAGLAKVSKAAYPDFTALDPDHEHFDPKSTKANPIWTMVDITFVKKFTRFISLDDLRKVPELADMMVLKRGSRLSVQPVEKRHFEFIVEMGSKFSF